MSQKLTSFSDRIVKKVKTQMKTEHLENTLNLKAYFKTGMPRSLIPKMKPTTSTETSALDLNLIKRAISLLPTEILPNSILAGGVRDSSSSLISSMIEYKNIVKEHKDYVKEHKEN